jgi:hypothetical protein
MPEPLPPEDFGLLPGEPEFNVPLPNDVRNARRRLLRAVNAFEARVTAQFEASAIAKLRLPLPVLPDVISREAAELARMVQLNRIMNPLSGPPPGFIPPGRPAEAAIIRSTARIVPLVSEETAVLLRAEAQRLLAVPDAYARNNARLGEIARLLGLRPAAAGTPPTPAYVPMSPAEVQRAARISINSHPGQGIVRFQVPDVRDIPAVRAARDAIIAREGLPTVSRRVALPIVEPPPPPVRPPVVRAPSRLELVQMLANRVMGFANDVVTPGRINRLFVATYPRVAVWAAGNWIGRGVAALPAVGVPLAYGAGSAGLAVLLGFGRAAAAPYLPQRVNDLIDDVSAGLGGMASFAAGGPVTAIALPVIRSNAQTVIAATDIVANARRDLAAIQSMRQYAALSALGDARTMEQVLRDRAEAAALAALPLDQRLGLALDYVRRNMPRDVAGTLNVINTVSAIGSQLPADQRGGLLSLQLELVDNYARLQGSPVGTLERIAAVVEALDIAGASVVTSVRNFFERN